MIGELIKLSLVAGVGVWLVWGAYRFWPRFRRRPK